MSLLRTGARVAAVLVLIATFAIPQNLLADTHVVSPSDLQKQITATTRDRQQNLTSVRGFLSTSTAEKYWAYARSWLRVAIDGISDHRP